MSGTVIQIEDDSGFPVEMTNAGAKLVVVDFFATWCGPCRVIAPFFEEMAAKYPHAVFLKVDVDKCQNTAAECGVSAMPTFIFYKQTTKIDMLRGADSAALEEKIKKWVGPADEEGGEGEGTSLVKGHMDLMTFINKSDCECLNEADDHPFDHALTSKGGYLESDCDEQLIISLSFNQAVKLHSLRIHAPTDKGPKNIKLFINQPSTLDFDKAESMAAVQAFELKPEDLAENSLIPLRYVKFQNVQNITVFIKDNQSGGEVTQIDYFGLIGSTVSTTNMSDFKRVAGKKGESH